MASFQDISYLPILAVRPAEMGALKELPEKDKDLLLPAIQLRPWVGSQEFTNTIEKVREVFGDTREWIANLDCDYVEPEARVDPSTGSVKDPRPAVEFFKGLCNAANGYNNWCEFVEQNEQIIPCLQLGDSSQFNQQLTRLAALERGLVLHLTSLAQTPSAAQLTALQQAATNNEILFIIDCGEIRGRVDLNFVIGQWVDSFDRISSALPDCRIAISSTSFPHDFSNGAVEQEIKERQLYGIAVATNQTRSWNLIYSDRGSARLQVQRGGGGAPYPRIDYPTTGTWYFYRSDSPDGEYQAIAQQTLNGGRWVANLRIWGTQMIERTAQGDKNAIVSPAKATAVRINIHLHQQLFYNQPENLLDTDDDWVD